MAYDLATVTNQGNKLLASVVSDRSSLVIDKIEVSGTKLASSTDLKSMKSISNVVTTLSANGYQKKDNSFIISTVLDNSSVKTDYQAWVFGIWAHETDGGSPILMSVITSTNSPDTISKGSGTPIDYNYKFVTTFSNTDSLTIKMSSDTYANNDTVIHNSGDETATGTKTFQEIKISNDKFPGLVQTDGQYVTLDGGNSEMIPADDSKVVHDNHDGTEQLNGVRVKPFNKLSDTIGGRNLLLGTSSVEVLNPNWDNIINVDVTKLIGTTLTYSAILDITDSTQGSVGVNLIPKDSSGNSIGDSVSGNPINWGNAGKVIATITIPAGASNLSIEERTNDTDKNPLVGSRKLEQGSIATDWTPAPEDKVNVSDMRKPASDVAGIEEVSAKQDKIGYTPADDSKVAHLSGANNFNTVPTVDDNPLLLASSLPSDLARTGSDQEFTGKNTFDTAPIDKTTGNPYITKDGVPSDVARTGKDANFTAKLQRNGQDVALANNTLARNPDTGSVSETNTFTAAQTFSIAPTIKDASTDKGDNQAATMADLKSVENSAWHSMTGSSDFFASFTCLYKINTAEKRIELIAFGGANNQNNGTIINLSSIISGITSVEGSLSIINSNMTDETNVDFSGTKLTGTFGYSLPNARGGMVSNRALNEDMGNNPCYVYYTGLV